MKGRSFSRSILIALFFCFVIFLSGHLFLFIHKKFFYNLAYLTNLFVFLSAPILYFYFLSYVEKIPRFKRKDFFHLIPFLIIFIIMAYNLKYNAEKVFVFTSFGIALLSVLFIQNIAYLVVIYKKLSLKKIDIFRTRPSMLGDEMRWVVMLIRAFSILIFLQLAIFLSHNILGLIEFCLFLTDIFFITSFLIINVIILIGLSKSKLFEDKQKYENSPLNGNIKKEYLMKLEEAFAAEAYIDPLLTLDKLSKCIRVPKNYLSQIINESFQMNFNELINKYRIEKAKKLIDESNGDEVIIEIAYKVGFNSKSTFNKAFKKYTGMTPSGYFTKKK